MPKRSSSRTSRWSNEVIGSICQRYAFPTEEAEEFASWAKLRLIDDDYAVLRKFRGESLLSTFLVTVVHNLFRDFRNHRWGKWRPSAQARRLGVSAVQLETLLYRDGHDLAAAQRILRERFACPLEAKAIEALAARLPTRIRRKFEGEDRLAYLPATSPASNAEDEVQRRELAALAETALADALRRLEPRERLLLKLRFEDGLTVAEIGKGLGVPAKPLYSRIQRSLGTLRRALEERGLDRSQIERIIGWAGLDLTLDLGSGLESAPARPSHPKEESV